MNYKLRVADEAKEKEKGVLITAWRRLVPLMLPERRSLIIALTAIFITSGTTLVAPVIVAHAVDTYIVKRDMSGVLVSGMWLLGIYLMGLVTSYVQVRTMGGVGRRVLFSLRGSIFNKLQELPVAFFNQNKAGDLISRINNDTDKLNQFFAQALIQFVGNATLILGAGVFLLVLNFRLGLAVLAPAAVVLLLTQVLSPWVRRSNLRSLRATGGMSGEVQESLTNFKVIVAFNRLDYFRTKFTEVNKANYAAAITAGVANNTFTPIYTAAGALAQLVALLYGIHLIVVGSFSIGLLIGFLLYVTNFYNPLRQLASVWSSLQQALAGLDRIFEVLSLQSNIPVVSVGEVAAGAPLLQLKDVSFAYSEGARVLEHVNITLEAGKTYALVGPTGGGKTTTALLLARLYDPTSGTVLLSGRDIRSYSPQERSQKIGFILQEPFLFSGTVRDNILYGNTLLANKSDDELEDIFAKKKFTPLIARFSEGLATPITASGESVSLGQKQLIAFMRAVLREPEVLILDEATANIDTVTEQLLEQILKELPPSTTRIIIAHRLNTIADADTIFFVSAATVKEAGTMEEAVEMLLHTKRKS